MRRHIPSIVPVELCNAPQLALMLGFSRRDEVWKRLARRLLPGPVRIPGTMPKWRIREVRDWIDAGCPTPCEPPYWVWQPAERVSVKDLLALLHKRAESLRQEISALESRPKGEDVWVTSPRV